MTAGVTSFQVPSGPVAVDRTTGPAAVAPTAAQVALAPDGGLWQDTPRKYWTVSLAGTVAEFQAQLPLVSDPSSSMPDAEADEVMAVTAQSAVSPADGLPQATPVTDTTEVGMPFACTQLWVPPERSPVQTAGAPVADPMATQVVPLQERPVTDEAPVGNVDSGVHVLGPAPATSTVITVGSDEVDWSPTAVATQVVDDGQAMAPTEVTAVGSESEETVGVHDGLPASAAGFPSSRRTPGAPPDPA